MICMLEEQRGVTHKGGTMRLGAQPCALEEGSPRRPVMAKRSSASGIAIATNSTRTISSDFEAAGFVVTGVNPDRKLAEIVELRDHPWFVAVQFHPEFKSKPQHPHPLFFGFIEAAINRHQARMPMTA